MITIKQPWTKTKDGKTLTWYQDVFMVNLLKPIIEEKDYKEKIRRGAEEIHPFMPSWVLSVLEQKILLESDRIISGKTVSDATLTQIKQISDAITSSHNDRMANYHESGA